MPFDPSTAKSIDAGNFDPSTAKDVSATGGEKPLSLDDVKHPITYMGHEITDAVDSSWDKLKTDFKKATTVPKDFDKESFWKQAKDIYSKTVASGATPVDAFSLVTAPIQGVLHGAVTKPVATGLSKLNPQVYDKASGGYRKESQSELERDVTEALSAVAPELGPGKTAGEVLAATKAPAVIKPKTSYGEAVQQLKDEGVDLTLGQMHGGKVRQVEEESKNNRFVGKAVKQAEAKAEESFNIAAYNRALAPIGEKYSGTDVGRAGIAKVGKALENKYDALTPRLKMSPDDTFLHKVVEVRKLASTMPEAQEKQFENILNQRVLARLGSNGSLDGKTFKQVESELSHLTRTYKSSADAAHRELGDRIEDLSSALRENLERTSDPSVREDLKKLNTSYAVLIRLENASAKSAVKNGVFSTSDLLQSVKNTDKSVRKRSFARGDALLQDFAERAHMVLKPTGAQKGEQVLHAGPGILGAGIGGAIGGLPGALIGGAVDLGGPMVTNPIAGKAMDYMKTRAQ